MEPTNSRFFSYPNIWNLAVGGTETGTSPISKPVSIYVREVEAAAQSQPICPVRLLHKKGRLLHLVADPQIQKLLESYHRYGPPPAFPIDTTATPYIFSDSSRSQFQALIPHDNLLTAYEGEGEKIRLEIQKYFRTNEFLSFFTKQCDEITTLWLDRHLVEGKMPLFTAVGDLIGEIVVKAILGYDIATLDDIKEHVELWRTLLSPSSTSLKSVDDFKKEPQEGWLNKGLRCSKELLAESLDVVHKGLAYGFLLPKVKNLVRNIIAYHEAHPEKNSIVNTLRKADIPRDAIEGNLFVLLVAGTETTSYLLGYILYEIAARPQLLKDAQLDLSTLRDREMWPFYLEALRLYPTGGVGRILNRNVTVSCSGGPLKGSSYTMGVDESINCVPYLAGRDPLKWEDPLTFNPSRPGLDWVKSLVVPFGSGPNRCIGEKVADIGIPTLLATILKKVILMTTEPLPPLLDAVTLKPEKDVVVHLLKRYDSPF